MDLVTTHIGADFDCLAAIVAAEKLYPGAVCVFPGSQEPSVREYIQAGRCPVQIQKIRQIDLDTIRRLIVVDTQSKERIGNLTNLLDQPDVEVHVYDHHTETNRNFRADVEWVREVGATTTIMVGLLMEQCKSFSPEEATLFNLGIHEDTCSFSSINTMPEDLEMANILLSKGADPTAVTELLQRDLNPTQIALLHNLMESAEEIRIMGTTITLSSASREEYVNNISLVAQKFHAAVDTQASFLLVRMGNKIQLVARSHSSKVDAGTQMVNFGGGGHPSAASAAVKNLTLVQVRDQLLGHLERELGKKQTAENVMLPTARKEQGEGVRAEPRTHGIKTLVRDRLSREYFRLLETAAQTANELDYTVYLVGGIVRDLLLGIESVDVDLVVEGDGINFAHHFADKENGQYQLHPRFGTANITFANKNLIDIATARVECYEQPAAMPLIGASDIRTDLYRRDFSINAMAIQLNGARAWRLLDYFDSRRDLKEKKLRVLHNLSFENDPTRAFRVVRFAERYGFSIGTQTLSLLENAVRNNLFDRLSGKRLFSELKLILSENEPWRHISHLSRLKLLRFIHPKLHETNTMKHRFGEIAQAINWYNLMFAGHKIDECLIYLIGLFEELSLSEMKSACQRLTMPDRLLDRALQAHRETDPLLAKLARSDISSSMVYNILRPLAHETLVYALSTTHSQQAKKSISLYLTHLKDTKLSIGGDDLISMGVEPGPIYRELLDATRDALLNGELEQGEVYERAYARRFLDLHKPD